MTKKEQIKEWLKNNENKLMDLEREDIFNKIMFLFDVTRKTADSYYYEWKNKKITPDKPKEPKFVRTIAPKKEKESNKMLITEKEATGKIKGKRFDYKYNNGIEVYNKDGLKLTTFKNMKAIKEYEEEENKRFAEDMQELKNIYNML